MRGTGFGVEYEFSEHVFIDIKSANIRYAKALLNKMFKEIIAQTFTNKFQR
jgi:hypothetical protein